MFVYPPLPPKDYVLKEIPKNQLSSSVFTPTSEPRVTLPTIGMQCAPVLATQTDPPPRVPLVEVNPVVIDNWADHARHHWVTKPGRNDYLIHDMYKKYNVKVQDSYDPRYLHKGPFFARSFKYELDCVEEARLKLLDQKVKRDEEENAKRRGGDPPADEERVTGDDMPRPSESTYQTDYIRWTYKPKLFTSQEDPCSRRADFSLFKRPFKNEACNWYYENYPPPKLQWRRVRFA